MAGLWVPRRRRGLGERPAARAADEFSLASAGFGSTIKLFEHLNGSVVLGVPFITQSPNTAYDPLLSFRVWGEL